MKASNYISRAVGASQKGIALVVALVLLIAVTLVGLAAIRGTSLQEKMAGNSFDREVSFQATEAALTTGAQRVSTNLASFDFSVQGLDCTDPNTDCFDNPMDNNAVNGLWTTVPNGTGSDQFSARDQANRPQYIVQRVLCPPTAGGSGSGGRSTSGDQVTDLGTLLGGTGECYRVTARNLNPAAANAVNNDRALVLVQGIYKR